MCPFSRFCISAMFLLVQSGVSIPRSGNYSERAAAFWSDTCIFTPYLPATESCPAFQELACSFLKIVLLINYLVRLTIRNRICRQWGALWQLVQADPRAEPRPRLCSLLFTLGTGRHIRIGLIRGAAVAQA